MSIDDCLFVSITDSGTYQIFVKLNRIILYKTLPKIPLEPQLDCANELANTQKKMERNIWEYIML